MKKFKDFAEAILSKGLLRAMGNGQLQIKGVCPKCGYVMPKYPGKYCNCPLCQTKFLNNPNPITNQDNGEIAVVPDEMIDATDDFK